MIRIECFAFGGLQAVFKIKLSSQISPKHDTSSTNCKQTVILFHIHNPILNKKCPKLFNPWLFFLNSWFIYLFICCVAPAHAGVKYFGDCPVVNLPCVITLCHPLVFLLLLALLFLWVVHADGELAGLCAILVLHHKGVFARVSRGDGGDCDTGELVVLKLEFVVVVRYQHLFVLRPGHLRYRLAPNVAS